MAGSAAVRVEGPRGPGVDEILDGPTLQLVADLQRRFGATRAELLARRAARQARFDAGELPGFLDDTREIRESAWRVAPPAAGLVDRRVEITGPTDAKMAINALNSGAKVWLADFEDANTPTFENMVQGQRNLRDAVAGSLRFESPDGRAYELGDELATIVARPRGWHLVEKHVLVDDAPVSASLFDFALFLAHTGTLQVRRGFGAYYYLPKLEGHLEAGLWDDVFTFAEEALDLARGSIRATVLIETLPAAFEMDEILFALRDHAAGLNAGRWDYLFSIVKKLRNLGAEFVLPDRNAVTMGAPFMRAYADALVATCHARGAHAIGGMAAFIPSRRDAEVNALAFAKVREDKEREAAAGFDGSWVAHPDLVPLCREVFDGVLGERPNQIERLRPEVTPSAAALLDVASAGAPCTEEGLRNDVSVGLQYLASWLGGNGAAAIFNLMEDVATAEIARSQIWQWVHGGVVLSNGETVTRAFVERVVEEELAALRAAQGASFDAERFETARSLFLGLALDDDFAEFLTLVAYDALP